MLKIFKFTVSVLICQGVGVLGSLLTSFGLQGWYSTLARPSFAPPNWVFAPVWIFLFFLMGLALYLVWSRYDNSKIAQTGLVIFGIQLLLNLLWSVFFFGLHNPLLALFEMSVLWVFILLSILYFRKISKWSVWLLVPYLLWVSFAFALNLAFVLLN